MSDNRTALDILKSCKDEVARKYNYTSWDHIIAEYPTNRSLKSSEEMLEEASLLAIEKIAEQSYDTGYSRGQEEVTMPYKYMEAPDKSTYMNNLFPNI